ncbi:MAG: MFS transporter [Chloroflexi bacterium]|nr:MFS transporter [Chloroflexota bacterium]
MKKLDASVVFLISEFTTGLASKIMFTTFVIYRVDVAGLDPLQLVLLGTLLEGTVFLFEIPTGIVADIYSRRLSVIIGTLLIGIGHAIEGMAPIFWVIMLSQFVWGLGYTFISGAFVAWITDEVGTKKVGLVFLRGDQLSLFGNLLGIPLAVFIAAQSLALPYMVGGAINVALGLFLILFMPEEGFKPTPPEEREGWRSLLTTFRAGIRLVRGRPALITFAVIDLVVGLYSEAWDRLAQPHLLERFRFPTINGYELSTIEWFGILNLIFIVVGIGANELAKRGIDMSQSRAALKALQVSYAGMVASMIVFIIASNFFVAIAAMVLFNGLRTITFPLQSTWVNQQIESKVRATVLSMNGQIDAIGQVSGGPILGAIGRLFSLRAALWASALTLATTVPLYQHLRNLTNKES